MKEQLYTIVSGTRFQMCPLCLILSADAKKDTVPMQRVRRQAEEYHT